MTPRFLHQKWYLYLFLSAFLPCEGTARDQGKTAVGKSAFAESAADESYRNLMDIEFDLIKGTRLFTEKSLSKSHKKLQKAFKGMAVTVNGKDKKWVAQNIGGVRKGKNQAYYVSAYSLLKKLLYSDGEGNIPIEDVRKWPPNVLIELDKTIKDGLSTKYFRDLFSNDQEFLKEKDKNTDEEKDKNSLKAVIGGYYYEFYKNEKNSSDTHIREETIDNWQKLMDKEESKKPAEVNTSIEITQSSSSGNSLGKAFTVLVFAVPTALWYQKNKQKTKKKSRKAKSMDY